MQAFMEFMDTHPNVWTKVSCVGPLVEMFQDRVLWAPIGRTQICKTISSVTAR